MKAIRAVGFVKASRFLIGEMACFLLDHCVVPQIRVFLLRLFGARIGRDCVIYEVRFINLYRGSFRNLQIGNECFVGHECLFDLAAPIRLQDRVTLAQRVTVLTHINVGFDDHPLQSLYPPQAAPADFGEGCFVGASSTILCGASIGKRCMVAAGSVVLRSTPDQVLVGGVPARVIHELRFSESPAKGPDESACKRQGESGK
jgi:acetyltransferase-like isoleucine patch superfamily enzyme